MTYRLLAILGLAATLAACETTTAYRAAGPDSRIGYSEQRIEPGRYRVSFQAGSGVSAPLVSDYALLRAAELTLSEGSDWFQVLDRFTEAGPPTSPRFSFGVGTGSYGHGGGFGVGGSTGFGGEPALRAGLEMVMGKGTKPQGRDYYDAHDVARTLHERLG